MTPSLKTLGIKEFFNMKMIPNTVQKEDILEKRKLKSMSSDLNPFDTKEQQLYSDLLLDVRTLYPISKAESGHAMVETHFTRL